jgi:hypothetical protein
MRVGRIQSDGVDEILVDLQQSALQTARHGVFVGALGNLRHAGNIA